MTTMKERVGLFLANKKVQISGASITVAAAISQMVPAASAAIDINGTVGPVLDSVILLIPTLVGLIVAFLPAIIVVSVIGFVVTFLDKIIGMLKI